MAKASHSKSPPATGEPSPATMPPLQIGDLVRLLKGLNFNSKSFTQQKRKKFKVFFTTLISKGETARRGSIAVVAGTTRLGLQSIVNISALFFLEEKNYSVYIKDQCYTYIVQKDIFSFFTDVLHIYVQLRAGHIQLNLGHIEYVIYFVYLIPIWCARKIWAI